MIGVIFVGLAAVGGCDAGVGALDRVGLAVAVIVANAAARVLDLLPAAVEAGWESCEYAWSTTWTEAAWWSLRHGGREGEESSRCCDC